MNEIVANLPENLADIRIAVIGTGSMGSLFAARLSRVAKVCVIGSWPEQLEALNKGFTVTETGKAPVSFRIPAFSQIENAGMQDLVLVLVKSYQTERAARQARALLDPASPWQAVLTLQNGVGNREAIAKEVGEDRAFLGITTQAAAMPAPGNVLDTGKGPILLAAPAGATEKIALWHTILQNAGFEVRLEKAPESLIWGKLAINVGINPLTTLFDVENGMLATHPVYRAMMWALGAEVEAVANAMNIEFPYPSVQRRLWEVAKATATNTTSMRKDIQRGARTEIDAICGAVVRAGDMAGVETPLNAEMLRRVLMLEKGGELSDRTSLEQELLAHYPHILNFQDLDPKWA